MKMNEQLIEKLQKNIDNDPSLIRDLMNLVSLNWEKMKVYEEKHRQTKEKSSVLDLINCIYLMSPKRNIFTMSELAFLLDPIEVAFPDGKNSLHSTSQKNILELFVKSCKHFGFSHEDEFIKKVRHKSDYIAMLYKQYENSI